MSDEKPFYAPDRKPPVPRTESVVGVLLWNVRVDHQQWRAELFDEGPYVFDVRLFRKADFFASRRLASREAAIGWANQQRGEIEKG